MTRIDAVIFDMDGVLIDAREWHYDALNRALNLFGYNISRYEHLVTFDGLPTRRKLEMLTMEQGLPLKLHGFLNDLKQVYTLEIVNAKCKPVFQHEYALSHLKANGYKLAVASNSVRQSVEVMMEKSKLQPYLDLMLSNEDVKRGKPDPEMYILACDRLGVKPGNCVIVEDNAHGIAAAKAAGGHVLAVRDPMDVTFENIRRAISKAQGEETRR